MFNQIKPPDDVEIEIVVTDGLSVKMKSGENVSGIHIQDKTPPSENDYSIGLRITFGSFVYLTCGDLDGEYATSADGYYYNDIESVYKDIVGEIDCYHGNHHGSQHSNNDNWLTVLKPTSALISCGEKNTYGHPTKLALDHITKWTNNVFLTENCNQDVTQLYDQVEIMNSDILIQFTKGNTFYQIQNKTKI